MAAVCGLAPGRFPRLPRWSRVSSWPNLPPRPFVSADDEAPLVVEAERMDSERTDLLGLGCEVWIMAMEPVHAPMRREVRRLQEAPQAGATHRPWPRGLLEGRSHLLKTPPGGGTMIRGRCSGGHRPPIDPRSGGQSAAGDPSAAHPAGR